MRFESFPVSFGEVDECSVRCFGGCDLALKFDDDGNMVRAHGYDGSPVC